jgi:hypothetical protein
MKLDLLKFLFCIIYPETIKFPYQSVTNMHQVTFILKVDTPGYLLVLEF